MKAAKAKQRKTLKNAPRAAASAAPADVDAAAVAAAATQAAQQRRRKSAPQDEGHRPKWMLAIEMLDALAGHGLRPPLVAADPADPRTLAPLGAATGAGERNLSRLFRRELRMTFPQWRTQLRLYHALRMLACRGAGDHRGPSLRLVVLQRFHRRLPPRFRLHARHPQPPSLSGSAPFTHGVDMIIAGPSITVGEAC